jgi:hypothetical protein
MESAKVKPLRSSLECDPSPGPLPFPQDAEETCSAGRPWPESASDALSALDDMSRHIRDLARELNCLGYFDDDPDLPRAA